MKVAEIDSTVHGILEEEYRRCCEVISLLLQKAVHFPKGALNVRRKSYKGKTYSYYYLVVRESGRVVNRHVSLEELPELRVQLEERNACRKEIQAYKKRIAYLEKLLKIPRTKGGQVASSS